MRYYVIAGEASGDLHGANLIKELLQCDSSARIRFWGGDGMAAAGGEMVRHYRDSAVMGIVEVIGKLGKIADNLSFCRKDIMEFRPDAVILIDYPGFNLKIARFAHGQGFKVFYYIPPKVWARGESRIKSLRKYTDRVFIIFPFEIEYFRRKGLEVTYHGNPLADTVEARIGKNWDGKRFIASHGLDDRPAIALLAGSRKMEIDYLLPRMLQAIEILEKRTPGKFQYLLAAAPSIEREYYCKYISGTPVRIIENDTYSVLKYSEAAIISSGTASLEAAIIGTPQVVCYGFNYITYLIAKAIVRLDTVSLANMILGKHIFRELIQGDCTAANITDEIIRLTEDAGYIANMKKDYSMMRSMLGERGAAGRIAADIVGEIKGKGNESI